MSNRLKIIIVIGGIVALSAAAYIGMQLLSPAGLSAGAHSLGLTGPGGGSTSMQSVSVEITPAPEIPARKTDFAGLVQSVQDNVITAAPMGNTVVAYTGEDGELSIDTGDNGPSVEIVITKETQIYLDRTFEDGLPVEDNSVLQQKVSLSDASEIQKNTMIRVWGSKRGDRLVAETILFSKIG
ncbi:MAG: hypothetical protein GYA17_01460 [Chloroflexi bacterium]|nr:hypothetical protein [Anaerolineaceae bacterium]NMB86993.1 hypothetical protein [Chloroflexota bacterium]